MSASAMALDFFPDGTVLAAVADKGVHLFATDDGATLAALPHETGGRGRACASAPTGLG
ncbi:hypothetical protein AB0F18_20505 [Streptomyces sp. NPDC029216]|uniref:hypothetical protein n=1 Tax=Streptomyces sp. NPDC029216 TaxID=3154701 RepID=UPI0033FDAE33